MSEKREKGFVVTNVYKFLITSQQKKASLSLLENKFQTQEDLRSLLSSHPFFWLGQLEPNSWEIRPKVEVKLCYKYKTDEGCDGECEKLHLCNENLLSPNFCGRPCRHDLSHNINDDHNRQIVEKIFPRFYKDQGGKVKILRSSFPRLCKSFTEDGSCSRGFCGYLHICPDYVKECCSGQCKQASLSNVSKITAHNFTIEHNKKVLASFNLSAAKADRPHLLANILIGGTDQVNQSHAVNEPEGTNNFRSRNLSSKSMSDVSRQVGGARKRSGLNKSTSNISLDKTDKSSALMKERTNAKSFSLCFYYINEKCKKTNCSRLHICKEYLAGACPLSQCKYGYSHNLLDDHNKGIIDKVKSCVSKKDALKFVRQSLPRLCGNYVSGQCQWGNECKGVHVCKEWLINPICSIENCKKSHNLLSPHNQKVAERYSNILSGKGSLGRKEDYFKTDLIFSKFPPATENNLSDDTKPPVYMSQQSTNSNKAIEPNEQDIFNYILNKSTNEASMHVKDILQHFASEEDKADSWIREHSKSFRTTCDKDGEKIIHLCLENVMPCFDYWSEDGCMAKPCTMFHVCKKYLFGIKHSSVSCKYNHKIEELCNSSLAADHNLQSVSPEHLLMLLRTRFPFVCTKNLEGNCLMDDQCPNIHVCGDFIKGKCKKADGLCSHQHESGLTTKHIVNVMNAFHITEENYQKCTIYKEDVSMSQTVNAAAKLASQVDFNSQRDEAICYKILNDTCMEGVLCSLHHPDPRLPYLWQYHEGGKWKNFIPTINVELEKFFSQPSNFAFDSKLSSAISEDLMVDFSQHGPVWTGSFCGNQVDVRRLSTKSSVQDDEESDVVGLTEWKWYWEKKDNDWEEYSRLGEDIEKSFLGKANNDHKFQTKEFKYALKFAEIEQQNLGPKYFTKRKVRRRPLFKDIKDIIKSKETQASQLPSHWPKEIQNGERISMQDKELKKEIQKHILASLGTSVDIVSVKEVCNRIFYTKYLNTKQTFIERLGEDKINEMMLYHGTSSDVAPQICVQNFDWRLNGKNATAYGQGSYFARDASYSNSYAREDGNGDQFMFLAEVLVGKYAKGDKSMKRPPADETTPGALYDSCVNNVSNPSIFVIFERDQCYPKYLIKYRKKNLNPISPNFTIGTIQPSATSNSKQPFVPQSSLYLRVGTEVDLSQYGRGVIRWKGIRYSVRSVGVELDMPNGNTDGGSFFSCQPNHGVFVNWKRVLRAWR